MTDLDTDRAVELLGDGGVVAAPTESSFGLCARLDRPRALQSLFAYKPERDKPLPIVVADVEMLVPYVAEPLDGARPWIQRYWPGALTIVFRASGLVPEAVTANTGTVGVRQPGHARLRELIQRVGVPLTATSANPPQGTPIQDRVRLAEVFPDLAVWIGGGEPYGNPPSTVVRIEGAGVRILRHGAVKVPEAPG